MNLHEKIRRLAYDLYEKSGRIPGREVENWLEAERIVMSKYAAGQSPLPEKSGTPAAPARKVGARSSGKSGTPGKEKLEASASAKKEPRKTAGTAARKASPKTKK